MDIEKISNLIKDNIKGNVYYIELSKDISNFSEKHLMIEVSEKIVEGIEIGEKLSIIGDFGGSAVMCSESETFELNTNKTSNSLFVVKSACPKPVILSGKNKFNIITQNGAGILDSYIELKKVKPNIQKLNELLSDYTYKGPEYEENYDFKNFITFNNLMELIKCSPFELIDALHTIDAVIIDGFWRIFDIFYASTCIMQIINIIDKLKIIYDQVQNLMPEISLDHCLSLCSDFVAKYNNFSFNEESVSKFVAIYILYTPKRLKYEDFMFTWKKMLPLSFEADIRYLRGVALFDENKNVITFFSERLLNRNLEPRLKELFKQRGIWAYDVIEPYLVNLGSELSPAQILNKYCIKSSESNGIPSFKLKNINKYRFS